MDFVQRRQNRICEYDYGQNGAYFVTICTHSREKTLCQIVGDGFTVLLPFGKIAEEMICRIPEKYPCVTVDKYVIMPDHIHLLLRIDQNIGTGNPSPTLGNVIGWLKYQATKQANMLWDTAGERRFQRSYYDHVVRNQQNYDEIWQYIDNNPRKWMIQHQGTE